LILRRQLTSISALNWLGINLRNTTTITSSSYSTSSLQTIRIRMVKLSGLDQRELHLQFLSIRKILCMLNTYSLLLTCTPLYLEFHKIEIRLMLLILLLRLISQCLCLNQMLRFKLRRKRERKIRKRLRTNLSQKRKKFLLSC
jgi:hypothetical protein